MKKKRFNDGGYTDQEASDLMKNDVVPKRSTYLTSDEPATPQSAEDTAAENAALAREAAQEARRSAPRVAPRVATPVPRAAVPVGTPSRNDYSMNGQEGSGRGTSTRAPSRNDYSINEQEGSGKPQQPYHRMPIEGAIDMIKKAPDAIGNLLRSLPHNKQLRKEKLLRERPLEATPMKKGGAVKASKRGDGIAQRGKTKGRMI